MYKIKSNLKLLAISKILTEPAIDPSIKKEKVLKILKDMTEWVYNSSKNNFNSKLMLLGFNNFHFYRILGEKKIAVFFRKINKNLTIPALKIESGLQLDSKVVQVAVNLKGLKK